MDVKKNENVETKVEEMEFTAEQSKNQMLVNENDFIQGLLGAVDYRNETQKIEVILDGKPFFSFRIRPLGEDEYTQCRKKYTKFIRNKQLGIKLPEDTDNVKYRCSLIYNATVEEDRKILWDNKDIWKALEGRGIPVVNALDVIEASLPAGYKEAIVDAIDKLSGFESSNLEEVAKN